MSRKIYTAKNDRMFKATFCDEENTYLLKEFLERIYFNDISKIKFLRSELVIKNIKSKNRMVDVLVENLKIIEYNMDRIMNFWYDEDEKNIIENLHLIILDLDIESLNKLLKDYNLSERDELFVRMFKKKIEDLNDDDYLVSSITRDEDLMRRINSEKSMSFDED